MSQLYIIPTPIGNLEDITFRAIRLLKEVDLVLAEDTRTSKKLFSHYNIETPLSSFHIYNEHEVLAKYVKRLKSGDRLALICDAGTPTISDPGFLIIRECIKEGIELCSLPGQLLLPALINSGIANNKFVFEGFLPLKKGRKKRLKTLKDEPRTIVLYESPHRILKTLNQIFEFFGEERRISISREISKIYEETVRGNISEVILHFEKENIKGEFVIIVEGKNDK